MSEPKVRWLDGLGFSWQVSDPFILGSDKHKSAVGVLADHAQPDYVEIDARGERLWRTWPSAGQPLVTWCHAPIISGDQKLFYKILDCTAFDALPGGGAPKLRALHAAYAAYAAVLAEAADDAPLELVRAELLYGAFELAVRMPFIGTRTVDETALGAGGDALDAIVPAIVWLARRSLMYVDLRGRNIVIDDDGHYRLVDYDDMVVLAEPAMEAEALIRAMRADAAAKSYDCAVNVIIPLEQRIKDCYKNAL